ncbi:hypothetical protein LIER_28633 [Lithospermum erythrorhizon]|uniref:Uncharacterized protein n=1 Tax=Lithospermum erythrorhizon TaxID=34254 RepID=A0AAV3RI97_LITER
MFATRVVTLDFTVGCGSKTSTIRAQFTVVDIEDPLYNGLIGRPILTALRAIFSPIHLKMKFPTPGGIGEVCDDQKRARICYQTSVPPINKGQKEQGYKRGKKNHMEVNVIRGEEEEDNESKERESEKKGKPNEELENVPFKREVKEKAFRIGTNLEGKHRLELISLVREYEDVFAWGPEDMPGIDPEVAIHRLYVDSESLPIKQKKRNFSGEKNVVIREEIQALLKVKAIGELKFSNWIANVVLVKKQNNKWRMCIDFTNLNKACPKDFYPLPCFTHWYNRPKANNYCGVGVFAH